MTNQSRSLRTISSLLLAGFGCGALSGCIVMVVPAATGGLIARHAVRRGGNAEPATTSTEAKAATPPMAGQPTASGGNLSSSSGNTPSLAQRKTPEVSALVVPSSDAATAFPAAGSPTSTWYDVIRFEAKTGLGTPDERRTDVLQPSKKDVPTLCGTRPTAVLIDAATIGAGDYSYVGSLQTMGYVILLTARSTTLPAGQVGALTKEGIPAPQPGVTLFKTAASDPGTRARILGRYCVVGLVGGQAGDFPDSHLPGSPAARPGWFLIAKP